MAAVMEVKVPDIGDFKDVPVIEVMVKAGDQIKPEDSLVSLESDKATMEVPAPVGGVVKEVKLKVGDKVSEGALILLLDTAGAGAVATAAAPKTSVAAPPAPTSTPAGIAEVRVPDIGDFKDVPVIEIMVKPGDTVKAEDALVTLESDKATMDVPAPLSGKVQQIRIKVGDTVSEGTLIMTLVTDSAAAAAPAATPAPPAAMPSPPVPLPSRAGGDASSPAGAPTRIGGVAFALAYARPGRRQPAAERGLALAHAQA